MFLTNKRIEIGDEMNSHETLKKINKIIINSLVLCIMLIGINNIIIALPYNLKILADVRQHYRIIYPETIIIHRALSTLIGFMLVFLSYRLYKRVRVAWIIAIIFMPALLVLNILKYGYNLNPIVGIEILIILILALEYKNFNRTTSPLDLKRGISFAMISIVLILLNTAIGLFILKDEYRNIKTFENAINKSIQLLFFMDISVVESKTRLAILFARSAIIINWASIFGALFLILKPLIYQPVVSAFDRSRVRELVNSYAINPILYLAVEEDKKYFFGKQVEGAIAYIIQAGVAVCVGEPICKIEDAFILLNEFISFCKDNDLNICFCQATDKFSYEFKRLGFGSVKYGEEALFKLDEYKLSGGKAAKVRYAVNYANKLSLEVFEYKPIERRDKLIEDGIMEVSREWLAIKKSSELTFMLGTIGLENPMDKRYFVCVDPLNKIQGFVVFTPFKSKKGYHADVTRRRKDAPTGVMEKTIVTAFNIMKEEGVEWGSLGLAPLANSIDEKNKQIVNRVLDFIYENMNRFYGFKTLHHFKKNFGPTHWETRYLYYYPGVFTPKIAYAILKAQNPKGVTDFLLKQIKGIFQKEKE